MNISTHTHKYKVLRIKVHMYMSIYVILHVYTTVQCDHYVHMYIPTYVCLLSECSNEHINAHT
jgi:hypothetical protein